MGSYKVACSNSVWLTQPELSILLKIVYLLRPNIAYILMSLYINLDLLVGYLYTIDSTRGTWVYLDYEDAVSKEKVVVMVIVEMVPLVGSQ
jgi:hypothetical protein